MASIVYDRFDGGIDRSRPANIQAANRFRELRNAFVTPGKTVRKRPGARYCWSWGTGVKGLFAGAGHLTGFYGASNTGVAAVTQGAFTQDAGIYRTTKLQAAGGGAALGNVVDSVRTAFLFAWAHYVVAQTDTGIQHYYTGDANLAGDNLVTDVNCPRGAMALPLASKVFGIAPTGVVRFSATDAPEDWTLANDAGFLPTDRKTRGARVLTSLGEFDGQLVAGFSDGIQLWNVDPDPQKMSFAKGIAIGQSPGDTGANVGADLFFLSQVGVRSILLNAQSGNAMDMDVGVPVDPLAREMTDGAFARFFASLGQFWLISGARALVYAFSRTAKVYAWSEYSFPWSIVGATEFESAVYLRSASGDIYVLDAAYPYDDDADAAVVSSGQDRDPVAWSEQFPAAGRAPAEVFVETPFFDFKSPASLKQIHSMDVVCTRERIDSLGDDDLYTITHLFRAESGGQVFPAGPIVLTDQPDDSRSGGTIPVGIMAPGVAARIEHRAPEIIELSALIYHFDDLGVLG